MKFSLLFLPGMVPFLMNVRATEPSSPDSGELGNTICNLFSDTTTTTTNKNDIMVIYGMNEAQSYAFKTCISTLLDDGTPIQSVQVTQQTTCHVFQDTKCNTNVDAPLPVPIPVPVTPNINLVNTLGLVKSVASSSGFPAGSFQCDQSVNQLIEFARNVSCQGVGAMT